MRLVTFIFILSLLSFDAHSSSSESCPTVVEKIGQYNMSRVFPSEGSGCSVKAMADTTVLKGFTRSFIFGESGSLVVFLQVDDQSNKNSRATASRVFYILPTQSVPQLETFGLGALITDSSGLRWTMSEAGELRSESGCTLDVRPTVSFANQGGFEVEHCPQRVVLDAGFRQGGNPLERLTQALRVIDPSGKSCSIEASQLFKIDPATKEFSMKFSEGPQLFAALKEIPSCSKLDLKSLLTADEKNFENASQKTIEAEPNKHSGAR